MQTKRLQILALSGALGGFGLSGCGEKADYSAAPAGGGAGEPDAADSG